MRTEVNIFFTLLFICSFIVSVAFTNEQNENGYTINNEFAEYTNLATISASSSNNEPTETVAAPSSDTSSMHGKIGEFEVYHQYVNVNTINLKQKYPPLPTRFFNSNERILFYKMNEQMSYDLINQIGYFSTYLALERHYLNEKLLR